MDRQDRLQRGSAARRALLRGDPALLAGLPDGALGPDYAGIRPKISARGAPAADFLVQGSREHGVPGLVHLFGIESPGLTASLPLADAVIGQVLNNEGPAFA
jgi:L-2-hydroxyglutarate oxidase LhgO